MSSEKRFPKYLYFKGEIVPYADARVHVLSTAFKYGAILFEGLRSYWSEQAQELYGFRLREHFQRLLNSMKIARIPGPTDIDEYVAQLLTLIRANDLREDIHMRVQVFVETNDGNVGASEPVGVSMAAMPLGRLLPPEGISVQVSSWARISDRVMPPRVKAVANYHNSRLALMQARADGYDDAVLLTLEGKVAEGPGYTLLGVQDGRLIAPPVTDAILEGVTRSSLLRLAKDKLGMEVVERSIDRSELYTFDEVLFCGSGAEVTPITSVDRHAVGSGQPGPHTMRLRDAYLSYARGDSGDEYGWLTPVYSGVTAGSAAASAVR
jgi:branched-chain amino acid aminotransferase